MPLLRLLIVGVLALSAHAAAAQPTSGRPNILLILVDDLRMDDLAHMPTVQQELVQRGLLFDAFVSTTPMCCPFRATMLRGQYAHNTGVRTVDVRPPDGPPRGGWADWSRLGLASSTVATWLDAAGYRTGIAGKFMNGYPSDEAPLSVDPGWDDWFVVQKHSLSPYNRLVLTSNGALYRPPATAYSTDVTAERLLAFMSQSVDDGQPFFAYWSPYAVHDEGITVTDGVPRVRPAVPAARHAGLFAGVPGPRTAGVNEADVSDKPPYLRPPLLSPETMARIDTVFQRRMETAQAVDEWVGRFLDTLAARGALDNTYVVLASDNGYMLGEHRLPPEAKGGPYEESIRLPLIIRGPGVPAGSRTPALAAGIDLAPTFAEWAGAAVPDFVDGRSLVPALQSTPPVGWRTATYVEHWLTETDAPNYVVVRTGELKLIHYYGRGETLFDIAADPEELEALDLEQEPDALEMLRATAAAFAACTGPSCREADRLYMPVDTVPGPGAPGLDLSRPAPHPVTTRSVVQLHVPSSQAVDVALFDVRGRRVQTVYRGWASGASSLVVERGALAAGVYLMRATSESGTDTQVIVLGP